MKIKYLVVMVVGVLMGTQVMNAQEAKDNGQGKRERKRMTMEQMVGMQANKIANDLGLDDKTTAKFVDVYKKYMAEQNEVRKEYSFGFKMNAKPGNRKDVAEVKMKMQVPTDVDIDKMMRDRFKQSRKMLDIREKYYDEFRKFLTPKQVQKVYDQGQMSHEKFYKEKDRRDMRRRAEMNRQKRDTKK